MIYISDYNENAFVALTLLEATTDNGGGFDFTITNQASGESFTKNYADLSTNPSRYNLLRVNVAGDFGTTVKGFYDYSVSQDSVVLETGLMYVNGEDTDFESNVYL